MVNAYKTVLSRECIDSSMKILVAIDNTRASKATIKEALVRAEEIGAAVTFVTCIEESASVEGDMIVTDLEMAQEESYESIEMAQNLADDYDVETEAYTVPHSDVVEALVEAIEEESPDFVYVGHRQLDPNDDNPVNSVARRLISHSPVPVTVVTYSNGNGHKNTETTERRVTS